MIYDHISNASKYYSLNKLFKTAFNYVTNTDFSKLENGKYPLAGENCFAIVNRYNTKSISESFAESHKKYIDIQFLVSGSEMMGFGYIHNFNNKNYEKDIDLQKHEGDLEFLTLNKDFFVILFPDDVHMPGIKTSFPSEVLKIVVKVAV